MSREVKQYYPFLDGFRALAALWVLLIHIDAFFSLESLLGPLYPAVHVFVRKGFHGVDVFFVISGFLISGLLFPDLKEEGIRIKRFYKRRMFKILPQYYLALGVAIIFTAIGRPDIFENVNNLCFTHVFFLQNYNELIPIFGHSWSLAVEEHFYLLYPVLLQLIFLIGRTWEERRILLLIVSFGIILYCNFVRAQILPDQITFDTLAMFLKTHLRFDALMFGCLLKLLEPNIIQMTDSLKRKVGTISFCIGMLIFTYIISYVERKVWFDYTLVYLATGLLFVSALCGNIICKSISEVKFFIWIGRNSYGIYLWHYVLIFPFVIVTKFIPEPLIIIVYIFVSIFVGVFTTKTVEKYFLNVRKKVAP